MRYFQWFFTIVFSVQCSYSALAEFDISGWLLDLKNSNTEIRLSTIKEINNAYYELKLTSAWDKVRLGLTEILKHDPYWEVRKNAAETLGNYGGKRSKKSLISLFESSMHDQNNEVRIAAKRALLLFRKSSNDTTTEYFTALVNSLTLESSKNRTIAAQHLTLSESSIDIGTAISIYLEGMQSSDWIIRLRSTEALIHFGHRLNPDGPNVKQIINEVLNDSHEEVVTAALRICKQMGESATWTLHSVLNKLNSPSPNIQLTAIKTLRGLHIKSPEIVNVILPFLSHTDISFRSEAIRTLGKITDKETLNIVLPYLKETINDHSEKLILSTLNALAHTGISDEQVISTIKLYISHTNSKIKLQAILTLSQLNQYISFSNQEADSIFQLLKSTDNNEYKNSLIHAISKLNNVREYSLRKLLDDLSEEKQTKIINDKMALLGYLGIQNTNTIAYLNRIFFNSIKRWSSRRYAAYALLDIRQNSATKEFISLSPVIDLFSFEIETRNRAIAIIKRLEGDDLKQTLTVMTHIFIASINSGHSENIIPDAIQTIGQKADCVFLMWTSLLNQSFNDPEIYIYIIKVLTSIEKTNPKMLNRMITLSQILQDYNYNDTLDRAFGKLAVDVKKNPNIETYLMTRAINGKTEALRSLGFIKNGSLESVKLIVSGIDGDRSIKGPITNQMNFLEFSINSNYTNAAISAIEALGKANSPYIKSTVVPLLRPMLAEYNPNGTRASAAKALGKLGKLSLDALPELIQSLNMKELFYVTDIIEAIGNVRHNPDGKTVQALIRTFNSIDRDSCKYMCVNAIGQFMNDDSIAYSSILKLAQTKDPIPDWSYTYKAAASVLLHINSDEVKNIFIEAINNESALDTRTSVFAIGLSDFDPPFRSQAIQALKKRLVHKNTYGEFRDNLARSLLSYGEANFVRDHYLSFKGTDYWGEDVLLMLVQLLNHGESAKPLIPLYKEMLLHADSFRDYRDIDHLAMLMVLFVQNFKDDEFVKKDPVLSKLIGKHNEPWALTYLKTLTKSFSCSPSH